MGPFLQLSVLSHYYVGDQFTYLLGSDFWKPEFLEISDFLMEMKQPLKILNSELDAGIVCGFELPPQDQWMVELGWISVFYAWEEEWNVYLVTRRIGCGIDYCDCGVDHGFPVIFLYLLGSQLDSRSCRHIEPHDHLLVEGLTD